MTEIYKTYKQMIERPTEPGFVKVNGFNSPTISYLMILDVMSADRQTKTPRKEYLDDDIDFVQIKTTSVCVNLKCLVKEKGKSFTAERISVSVTIDPKKKEFTSVMCNRCEGMDGVSLSVKSELFSPLTSHRSFM